MKTMKKETRGRKPGTDNKMLVRVYVRQSVIDANGGHDACAAMCVSTLEQQAKDLLINSI